jgi:hypothetical protein
MALGFYRYLSRRLSICDHEMECATVDLLYDLRHYEQNLVRSDPEISADVVQHDERSDGRWMLVAFPALILAFCLEILHFFDEGLIGAGLFGRLPPPMGAGASGLSQRLG